MKNLDVAAPPIRQRRGEPIVKVGSLDNAGENVDAVAHCAMPLW